MPAADLLPLAARLESATDAMEAREWPAAIGLLVGLLADLEGLGHDALEATTRALLAQSLASGDRMTEATEQATRAMAAAERSNDRDVIHRCMALLTSLRFMT